MVTGPSAAYVADFQLQYPLTISASPAADGTTAATPPSAGGYYNLGAVVAINATANSDYTFTGWTGNVASPSSASTTVTMTQAQTVVANFTAAAPPSPVTVFAPLQGATNVSTITSLTWGAVTGATSYAVYLGTSSPPPLAFAYTTGTTYSPAMSPGTTYYWQVAAANAFGSTLSAIWSFTTAPQTAGVTIQTSPSGLQFSVDSGAEQTAPQTLNLSQGTHTLAVATTQASAGATLGVTLTVNATISLTGTSGYPATGTAALTGGITDSGTFSATIPTSALESTNATFPYTLTLKSGTMAGNLTLPVAAIIESSSGTGTATVTSAFGSYSGDTGSFNLSGSGGIGASGITLTFSGIGMIATGMQSLYLFTGWSDGGAASHNITVGSSAATYTASFATQYLLTTAVSPAGAGSVVANPSSGGYYNAGTSVQLTASANAGYQFSNWTGDISGSMNPQSITMNAAHSVTANFGTQSSCSFALTPAAASLPATGTSTVETCPNNSGQPNCGVTPELPLNFTVTPSAVCGTWTATSSNPEFLQITSGASGGGAGAVGFALLSNTHNGPQNYTLTVTSGTASATYPVTEAGSGDSQVYREVYALYEQLLGRDPDSPGLAFWSGSGGASLGQMADSFLTSPEDFDSDFAVVAAYQAATGAPPTYAQFTAAVASVQGGTQKVGGLFNSLIGSNYTVATLYQNLLNRQPSASEVNTAGDAGLAGWFEYLIGYPGATTPVSAPNNEFQSTGIYQTTLAADHTNALYVQMIYYVTVSRDPDAAGLAFWTGIANSGGPGILFQGSAGYSTRIQILGPGTPNQGFIGSLEFQGLFAN
jgi:uncharacterized repeat protein (TIGR02543 family)